MLKIRHSE